MELCAFIEIGFNVEIDMNTQNENPKMLSIDEIRQITDVNILSEQCKIRQKLIGQMVGSLYPSILRDEIDKIHNHIDFIKFIK